VSLNVLVLDEAKTIVYEPPYRRHFGRWKKKPPLSIFTASLSKAFAPLLSPETTGLSLKSWAYSGLETISQVLGVSS
jgi:hypothetical protein